MSSPIKSVSPENQARLRELIDEVLCVNQQFNLTAVRDPDEAWTKHVLDSLQLLDDSFNDLWAGSSSLIDVGSGAGFPGLPLAIVKPTVKVTLLEATRKKCDFLRSAIEKFDLNARVLNERAETAGQNRVWRERYNLATARAVGSVEEVCELVLPLVKPGGHAILWRGQHADAEVKAAHKVIEILGGTMRKISPYHLPGHPLTFHLVVIEKTGPTPTRFPRREGLPKHQPLGQQPVVQPVAAAKTSKKRKP